MPAIILPYQTLFYNPRNAAGGSGYPILGRTVRPVLNGDFVHHEAASEETTDSTSENANSNSITKDTLLRLRASAQAQLNALNDQLEGRAFGASMEASRATAQQRAETEERARKQEERLALPFSESDEEESTGFTFTGISAVSPQKAETSNSPSIFSSTRGFSRPQKPSGSGLNADIGTGAFQRGSLGEPFSSGTFSSGTVGMGGLQYGAILSYNGNAAALYGRSATMGGFSSYSYDAVASVSFSRVG